MKRPKRLAPWPTDSERRVVVDVPSASSVEVSELLGERLAQRGIKHTVLNAKPDIEFLVEGHTDNVPITGGAIVDNWDLSTRRATAVVRLLQNQFKIDPKRMTAGGRSEYLPLQSNDTPAGRAANRRTRIVILPQLDQFFKLLETPKG